MNQTTRRFMRSTREAFPHERAPSVFGPYRRRRWYENYSVIVAIVTAACLLAPYAFALLFK